MKTSSIDIALLELFDENDHHLKANEVYERLQPRFPALSPSTVYRALERLVKSGKISVSDMGTGAMVYEKVADGMHHHLVCHNCGKIETIQHHIVGDFFSEVKNEYSFHVYTNHLILFGYCKNCIKKK